MRNETEGTLISMRPVSIPTTLQVVGDVGFVLHSSCVWKSPTSEDFNAGNISIIRLPDKRMRFGLGAAAFGPSAELAVQQLGECALIEGRPWWTPAERQSRSRREDTVSEMLTPFLFAWDTLDSAWASFETPSCIPLIKWYERILGSYNIGKTGAIALQVIAQIPAKKIVDKYMCRAPLAEDNLLPTGRMITDPDLIDTHFFRNAVRHAVSEDTICTAVMVGIVVDPAMVAAKWGNHVLQRGFYTVLGMNSHTSVIHHTHATIVLDSFSINDGFQKDLISFDKEMSKISEQLDSGKHKFCTVHIEDDTQIHHAIARIGIIEDMQIAQ